MSEPARADAATEDAGADRVALVATIAGAAIAIVERRDLLGLATGLALGLGGVLYALRGRAPTCGARSTRLLGGVLALVVALRLVGPAAQLVESLRLGQLLADGLSPALDESVRTTARVEVAASWAALALALAFLVAAALRRRR